MLRQKSERSRYYGDFRGVDFSSDHTLVHESRFPYLVNMYKDYASGGGHGIETVPGFRRRFAAPNGGRIYGIHSYKLTSQIEGVSTDRHVLVHAGDKLYKWGSYPEESGDSTRTVAAVIKEYDEYSSDIEGIKIFDDYVRATVDLSKSYMNDGTAKVFTIQRYGDSKRITTTNVPSSSTLVYVEDAFRWSVDSSGNTYNKFDVVIKKVVKDDSGKIVARFEPGDALQIVLVVVKDGTHFYNRDAYAVEYDEYSEDGKTDFACAEVRGVGGLEILSVRTAGGVELTEPEYIRHGNMLIIAKDLARDSKPLIRIGQPLYVTVKEKAVTPLYEGMNAHESVSFVFGDRIYILDGKHYLVYDGSQVSRVMDDAYIPTTYINIVVGGENADAGTELEARNILQPRFKHTFIADGETKEYHMNENMLERVDEVKVYGRVVENYTVDLVNGKIEFDEPPAKPETVEMSEGVMYPETYAGIEITASKMIYPATDGYEESTSEKLRSMIDSATLATVFDNRVFFSGIASAPNLIFWSSLKNPTYIGVLNYTQDGIGTTPITAMLPIAGSLLVLKGDTEQDGAVYYHTPYETGVDVMPKTYPSEAGLAGTGCLGAACNFLDDPVYVSRLGLEAIGQLSVRLERSREHRSSLVDSRLVTSKLSDARLCEWGGYLVLLCDATIFLADSRQVYQNKRGEVEYEWYYLEGIGVYDGQHPRGVYLTKYPSRFIDEQGKRVPLTINYKGVDYEARLVSDDPAYDIGSDVEEGTDIVYGEAKAGDKTYGFYAAMYKDGLDYVALLCENKEDMVGGEFFPAVSVCSMNDNVYFGTANGVVCSFNFDMREADGTMPLDSYSFDGRRYVSGCALKMDNCGVPHLNKTTVKRSTVIKTKSFQSTAAKVRVRTNNDPYKEIARINATLFSFDDMDFSDFSFVVTDNSLFSIKEKEKKWIEKQYYIYSDDYQKPFALLYAAFKYFIAGKFKK